MKYKFNPILFIIILILALGSIGIYKYCGDSSYTASKTVVLDSSYFDLKPTYSTDSISLDKIQRLELKDIYTNIAWVDNNHIAISIRNSQDSFVNYLGKKKPYFQTALLNIDNSSLENVNSVNNKSQYLLSVSPDNKKIIYMEGSDLSEKRSENKAESDSELCIYDNKAKNVFKAYKKIRFLCWMPHGSEFIAIRDNISIYDASEEKSREIIAGKNFKALGNIIDGKVTRDGKKLFLYTISNFEKAATKIYAIDLENQSPPKLIVEGDIKSFELLDGVSIVYSGKANGKRGIYQYDLNNNSQKLVVEGDISYFKLSKDRKSIAYVKSDEKGEEVIYVSSFAGLDLEANTLLYKGRGINLKSIQWSENGKKLAVMINENLKSVENTNIYFFNLK